VLYYCLSQNGNGKTPGKVGSLLSGHPQLSELAMERSTDEISIIYSYKIVYKRCQGDEYITPLTGLFFSDVPIIRVRQDISNWNYF